jgi:cytochrome c-type biogenesis protein CcmF
VKASLGVLALALGATSAFLGIAVLGWGIRRGDERLLRLGRRYAFMILGASALAVFAMEWALITHDFSLRYVAENNARSTPLLFTITGLWAALEGSILLWGLILGGYLAYMAYHFRKRATDPVVAWAMLVGFAVALFFFILMLGPADPFKTLSAVPANGQGPNPLLQNHPLMAFHPPMLYMGYVGMTVPFAFAIAALITGRLGEGWLTETRRSTLVAWGFLSVGIILGAWWSYEVLGWGGYWAWDPVENASLLPWLTATAFIHSVIVQERRGMLRVWNLSLVVATFCLTILGTFLTRSGVLNSVHSFTESPIGPWLLGFLAFVTIGSVLLIAWRGDKLRAPGRIDSPVSREAAFLVNNLLFAALAVVVLLGTVYPLLAEALQNRQLSVGEPYFDRMTTPVGVALLFFMAVAPALPWRATSGEVLRKRLIVPAWFGVGVMLVAALLGVHSVWTLLTFGLAAFAIGGIVRQFAVGFRAQHAAGASWWQAPVRTVRGSPRLYGGLIVHAGIVAIAVALAASSAFTTKDEVRLNRGETATVSGYDFTYVRRDVTSSAQKRQVKAQIRIERDGKDLGTYAPAVSMFPGATSGIGTPSVRTGLLRDVYLTLVSAPTDRDRVTIGIAINPMVVWIWIGGGLIAVGTIVALLPARRRAVVPPRPAAGAGPGGPAGNGDGPGDDGTDRDDRDVPATVTA